MFYRAKILVTLKPEVKDSKAQVLEQVITRKEFAQNPHCHCGKYYSLEVEAEDLGSAKLIFVKIGDEILANTVIEQYEILALEELKENEQTKSGDYCLSCN